MCDWLEVLSENVRVACRDFGGTGRCLLMLHGLAGHSGEWSEVAAALAGDFRLIALDQRGHGRSEREPSDLSRPAFVGDVVAVVEQLSLAPVVLIGQSMGGNTAFLAAAAHPGLVESLVVIEASPDGPDPELPAHIRRWLDGWPASFADEDQAKAFFASQGLSPVAWCKGLERRDDGLSPAFEDDVMVKCIAELAACDYLTEWRSIRCPTLVVRAERGYLDERHLAELAHALPHGQSLTIPNAGHDVHLDAPKQLAEEIRRFLA